MLFLDTCVVVDILLGRQLHYLRRLEEAEAAGQAITISSLVLHELSYGAMISPRPDFQLNLLDAFIARTLVEPWTPEDAVATARVRAGLGNLGHEVRAIDSLIAGQAINRGWPLVTSNVKDFIRIPEISLIDWSDPAGVREINQATRAEWVLANLHRSPKEAK